MSEEHLPHPRFYKLVVLTLVVLPFLGVITAMVLVWNTYVFPSDIVLFLSLYLATGLGITIGYHRMLTHQSFRTFTPIKAFFLILGCMAFEGSPLPWAAAHIKHHAKSDDDSDPHTTLERFWHSHLGWLFRSEYQNPEVYAPHLLKDPVIVFVDRFTPLWMIFSLAIPAAIGGWTGLLWGGLVRIFITTHATWSVNSVCHTFGKRTFESHDESRNEWIVGLLAFGEGWHNNHHAFPESAFHGLRWWQFDLSGLILRSLEAMGLIWNVQRVSGESMEEKRIKAISLREKFDALKEQLKAHIESAEADLAEFFDKNPLPTRKNISLQKLHINAKSRLHEIRREIERRKNLREQLVERYKKEIAEAVQSAKQRASQELKQLSGIAA